MLDERQLSGSIRAVSLGMGSYRLARRPAQRQPSSQALRTGVHLDRPNTRAAKRDRRTHLPGCHGCWRCRNAVGASDLDAWAQAVPKRYKLARGTFTHADRGPIKVFRHPPPRHVHTPGNCRRRTPELSQSECLYALAAALPSAPSGNALSAFRTSHCPRSWKYAGSLVRCTLHKRS